MGLTREGVKRTIVWITVLANVPVLSLLLLSAYSDRLNPSTFPLLSICGLLFPVALVATLVLLVVWVVFYWRGAVMPVAALLLCLPAIRQYYPMNRSQSIPDDAIKVLSYNVLMFAPWEVGENEKNHIVQYIVKQDPDIVCLQEASPHEVKEKHFLRPLKQRCPYFSAISNDAGECLMIFSKFPILSENFIPLKSRSSMAQYVVLDINGKKTMIVNCHLQSVGLSVEEKGDFKRMVENQMDDEEARAATRSLLRKLRYASMKRGKQADRLVKAIGSYRADGYSVIVCGDFNDTPLSYAHRTVAEGLTDCYIAAGNGVGYSYQQNGMYVRIDNILCSGDWEPVGAKVDKEVDDSDHFPIVAWLKNRPKE